MNHNYRAWKQKVESVPLENIANSKEKEFMSIQAVYNGLHLLIGKLPQPDKSKVLLVLAQELQEFGITFSACVMGLIPSTSTSSGSDDLVEEWGKSIDNDFGLTPIK